MTELRWSATVSFEDNRTPIIGELATFGEFKCSDPEIESLVNYDINFKMSVSPIALLPPIDSLEVSYDNPASIAASFFWAVVNTCRSDTPDFVFHGKNYLLPGMTLDDVVTDGRTDTFTDAKLVGSSQPPVSELFAE
jgi:hypothetical protein